jgi:hypothetical protein
MPAIWTPPKNWAVSELLTADNLNIHLRDNLEWLKAPDPVVYISSANVSLSSTTPAYTGWDVTVNSGGGGFLVWLRTTAQVPSTANQFLFSDVEVDGVREGTTLSSGWGLMSLALPLAGHYIPYTFLHYVTPKPAGSHTFKLMVWSNLAGTLTLNGISLKSEFGVRELR